MIEWVIYYSDGRRITSDDMDVKALPALGVEVVLQADGQHGRRIMKYCDYYLWSPTQNRWFDMQDAAALVLRTLREPWVRVLAGEYLREDEFERILIAAYDDPDLKGKSPAMAPHPAWKLEF